MSAEKDKARKGKESDSLIHSSLNSDSGEKQTFYNSSSLSRAFNSESQRPQNGEGCCTSFNGRRPYWVEIPTFIYMFAYRACLPLKEQLIFAVIASKYMSSDEYPPSDAQTVLACGAEEATNSSQQVEAPPLALALISPLLQNVSMVTTAAIQTALSTIGYINATTTITTTTTSNASHQYHTSDPESEASEFLSYLNLARNLPGLFATLLIVSYTDIGGRRVGMILPSLGGAAKSLVTLITIYFRLSINFLYIGDVIEGICGSIMTVQSVAYAYLSDIVTKGDISFRFTVLQSLYFLGTAFGNVLVGYTIEYIGYIASYWIMLGLFTLNIVYVFILLPDSIHPDPSRDFSITQTIRSALTTFHVYWRRGDMYATAILGVLLVAYVLDNFILQGRNDVDVLYMVGVPFCWTSVIIGLFQMTKYLAKAVAGTVGVRAMSCCVSDAGLGVLGGASGFISNMLMAFAPTTLALWMVTVVGMLSGLIAPIASAMMSKVLPPEDQGSLFASLGVVEGMCDLVSATSLDLVFAATVKGIRGSVFILISALYFLCIPCFIAAHILNKKGSTSKEKASTSKEKDSTSKVKYQSSAS